MLRAILGIYVAFMLLIVGFGIIARCYVAFGMKGRLCHKSEEVFLRTDSWWGILLLALIGGIISLVMTPHNVTELGDRRIVVLAVRVLLPPLCVAVMSVSGYLLLLPLGLRGLGQKLGILMGVVMWGCVRELLMS